MSVLLFDSGVWIAALDVGDRFHDAADRLVSTLMRRGDDVGALDLTLYEVTNVAARWNAPKAAGTLQAMVIDGAGDRLIALTPAMLEDVTAAAFRHRLSAYDAAYVATSQALGWTLVSTDLRDLVEPGFAITPDQVVL